MEHTKKLIAVVGATGQDRLPPWAAAELSGSTDQTTTSSYTLLEQLEGATKACTSGRVPISATASPPTQPSPLKIMTKYFSFVFSPVNLSKSSPASSPV